MPQLCNASRFRPVLHLQQFAEIQMNSSLVLRKRAKHCNTLNVHSANHEADIYAPCNPVPPHTLNIYPAQGVRGLETTALSRNPTRYPNSPIAVARQRSCRTQGSYHMVYATTLYCIILSMLYYTILSCTVLYYTVPYYPTTTSGSGLRAEPEHPGNEYLEPSKSFRI